MIRALPFQATARPLIERYGLPRSIFNDFNFWLAETTGEVWMAPALSSPPTDLETVRGQGWRILTDAGPSGRPTRDLLRIIGADATRGVVQVSEADAAALDRGERLRLESSTDETMCVVRVGHRAVGGVDTTTGFALP